MTDHFDPETLQGNILRGYKHKLVRYLILEVGDRAAARRFLAAAAAGGSADVPPITGESKSGKKWHREPADNATPKAARNPRPKTCFNVGLTWEGLKALGVSTKDLTTFPTEFKEGMTRRAMKLGDFGDSAPTHWPPPFDQHERVHVIASIYADTLEDIEPVAALVGRAFTVLGVRDGRNLKDNKVFFGYRDSISQPRFEHVADSGQTNTTEPIDPLGTVLLGHPTLLSSLRYRVPQPNVLGRDGAFNAFRVLAQDCAGFEAWLDAAASTLLDHPKLSNFLDPNYKKWVGSFVTERTLNRLQKLFGERAHEAAALRETVAAQLVGRWRNGVPLELSPDEPLPGDGVSLTNFDYNEVSRCPAGAHLRRCNPRTGPIVQRIANDTRRLVRRGMSYGPDFDPDNPDQEERGLLGNFIGASLGAQFEAVMCDWLNLGLQDPDITGSNDPLLGANTPETSWFDLLTRVEGDTIRIYGLPRFVKARGGAYTFLPSLPALRYLGGLST
jgi:deferrochelatase/peroxidase EfeB